MLNFSGVSRKSWIGQVLRLPLALIPANLIATQEVPSPDYLKIDVEGAEFDVLRGAKKLLQDKHPTLVLALHGDEVGRQCRQFLQELGYQMKSLTQRPLDTADEIYAYY